VVTPLTVSGGLFRHIRRIFTPAFGVLCLLVPMAATPFRALRRDSFIRMKPLVMLVRIEPGEEPKELALDELGADVVRVRHPLPACARLRVVRPMVVIVNAEIRAQDVAFVRRAASEIGARVLQLGPIVARDQLRDWLRDAIDEVSRERASAERSAADAAAQ
jgi:hypothetical protein